MKRRGFTLIELLVVIAIIGMLIALLLPAIQSTRESGRQVQCKNNLRQIALAMQLHDQCKKSLPPARVHELNGPFVVILPFLEESEAYSKFDFTKNYNEEPNVEISNRRLPVYLCPTMNILREMPDGVCDLVGGPGSYAASVSTGNLWTDKQNGAIVAPGWGTTSIKRISMADGSSKTFLVGEMDFGLENFYWATCMPPNTVQGGITKWARGYPASTWGSTIGVFNSDRLLSGTNELQTYRSDHPGGCSFAMADGSVHFVRDTVADSLLDALATREGGEAAEVDFAD